MSGSIRRLCALVAIALALCIAIGAAQSAVKFKPEPEVKLRLVDPAEPALVVVNPTRVPAQEIFYQLALWDLDRLEGADPLPIPGGALKELAPGATSTPKALFDAPEVRAQVKRGDRIAGAIAVKCTVCWRGFTYRVYLVYGEGGWIAEVEALTSGAVIAPRDENGEGLRGQALEDSLLRWANGGAARTRLPIVPVGR